MHLERSGAPDSSGDSGCSIRGERFLRAGLQYENPGEATKDRWDNIKIPGGLRFQEDLDEVLETIVSVYHQLTRHGVITPRYEQDERRPVMDLGIKVERGTDFRMWFYGGDAHQDITTVRMWIQSSAEVSLSVVA